MAANFCTLPRSWEPRHRLLLRSSCLIAFATQSAASVSAQPVAQTQAGREVAELDPDGGDTPVYMPPSPCTLPTVDEEGSQELAPGLPDDQKIIGEL